MLPEELLKNIAAGDERSFRRLYELFSERVYNTCLLYLQNEEEAEETLQDTFLQVHQSAATFKGGSTVQTWIYRISINKCLDKIRYKKRVKRFAFISSLYKDTGAFLHEPGDFQHPGILLENKDKSAYLFRALKELPENQYSAFVLKQVEGLPQKEVAAIMGISEKAVESLFQRAKAKLRTILSGFYDQSKD
jgi:RNA polymerase sigma-70 factor (ECF subfamily)